MSDGFKVTATAICALVLLIAVGWGLGWFGLVTQRPMAKYGEETRRQVWENSISREQGVNHLIAGYCLNMRTAADPASKKAFARLILDQSGTFSGQLTDDSASCVSESNAVLGLR